MIGVGLTKKQEGDDVLLPVFFEVIIGAVTAPDVPHKARRCRG